MIIATHNGTFHADEVIGCMLLSFLYPDLTIIRSRDPLELAKANYVIDVGGKFDLEVNFDHHPSEFTLARDNQIKFASAGLVWNKFGEKVLEKLGQESGFINSLNNNKEVIFKKAFKEIDSHVMCYLDLVDNGQLDEYTQGISLAKDSDHGMNVYNSLGEFYTNTPSLPYIIAMQNTQDGTDEEQYEAFMQTIASLKPLFKNLILRVLCQARDEEKVLSLYDGSEILIMDERLPWLNAVLNNFEKFCNCKIAIYPDSKKGYRIQSLPLSKASRFLNRAPAPKSWCGKEGDELNILAGISSATFVHKTGFTGGAKTKEDIMVMAKNWLAGQEKK